MGWSKNHGTIAKVNADYAKEQANVAKQEATNLAELKTNVEAAIQNASTAAENANAVIEDANTAASNADNAASEAIAQANHAKNEGDRAKAEADRLAGTDVSKLDNKITEVTTQLAQTAKIKVFDSMPNSTNLGDNEFGFVLDEMPILDIDYSNYAAFAERFGVIKANGANVLLETQSKQLTISENVTADACLVYLKETVPMKLTRKYVNIVKSTLSNLAYLMCLDMYQDTPFVGTQAQMTNTRSLMRVIQNTDGGILITKRSSTNAFLYWNNVSNTWSSTTTVAYSGQVGETYQIEMITNVNGVKVALKSESAEALVNTDEVLWSDLTVNIADSLKLKPFITIGDMLTDAHTSTIISKRFMVLDNTSLEVTLDKMPSFNTDFRNTLAYSRLATNKAGNTAIDINTTQRELRIYGESVATDAGFVYLKDKVPALNREYKHQVKAASTGSYAYLLCLDRFTQKPKLDTLANQNTNTRAMIRVMQTSNGSLQIYRYSPFDGIGYFWDNTAKTWLTNTNTVVSSGALNTYYNVIFTTDDIGIVVEIREELDITTLAKTNKIPWSDLATNATMQPYLYWGDIYTDNHWGNTTTKRFVIMG